MKKFLLVLFLFSVARVFAQNDIVLDLDSIKNIKTTRYSTINEVGVNVNIGGDSISKFPNNKIKRKISVDKPGVLFRTVHGVLINPKFFIGGGLGIDFAPEGNSGGVGTVSRFSITFPVFVEMREYVLDGDFNIFFSERMGAGFYINPQLNKYGGNGKASGAFGEFQIGGRYLTAGKKLAVHFGVGYRLQHLQHKVDAAVQTGAVGGVPTYTSTKITQVTLKHYIPIVIGITF